jgi:hypothetical protein
MRPYVAQDFRVTKNFRQEKWEKKKWSKEKIGAKKNWNFFFPVRFFMGNIKENVGHK